MQATELVSQQLLAAQISAGSALATALVAAFGLFFALLQIRKINQQIKYTKASYKFSKFIDVNMKYVDSYNAIIAMKNKVEPNQGEIKDFFKKFWSLQAEKFDPFLMGVIDPITYSRWLRRKVHVFKNGKLIGDVSGWTGWVQYGRSTYNEDPMFVHLIESIFSYSHLETDHAVIEVPNFMLRNVKILYESRLAKTYRDIVLRDDDKWTWGDLEKIYNDDPMSDAKIKNFKKFPEVETFSTTIFHEKSKILIPEI